MASKRMFDKPPEESFIPRFNLMTTSEQMKRKMIRYFIDLDKLKTEHSKELNDGFLAVFVATMFFSMGWFVGLVAKGFGLFAIFGLFALMLLFQSYSCQYHFEAKRKQLRIKHGLTKYDLFGETKKY